MIRISRKHGYLRSRGIRRMSGYVLRENAPMHALVVALGFEPESLTREPGTVFYTFDLHPAANKERVASS